MGDSWNIVGWGLIVLACLAAAVVVVVIFWAYAKQWLIDIKRKRAHAGKVKCESHEGCDKLARWITPTGYACDEHEGYMSKKYISVGSVQWAHRLNYTLTSERTS